MKLVENYSLQLGQKIDKPYVCEKFFPLPFSDYIVLQPFSKNSKNFDYWQEVLDIILPIIKRTNIEIVQVGGQNEKALNGCYHTQGGTSWGQLQYIIKNAKLVVSTDSISSHLAGHYNVPLVVLISNNFKECVAPYFGDKSQHIILEPNRKEGELPSFALEEHPKLINKVRPETIAESVLKLLNIEYTHPYKSLVIGISYNNTILETVPNQLLNPQNFNAQFLNMRMDFLFNEEILAQQLQICPLVIVTDKPIKEEILKGLRPNIKEMYYEIKEDNDPKFVKLLCKYAIPYYLYSYLPPEKLNPIKLDYMDFNLIMPREIKVPEILKNKDLSKVYFRSNKFTLSSGAIFSSYAGFKANQPIKSFQDNVQPIINNDDFYREAEYYYIIEKIA